MVTTMGMFTRRIGTEAESTGRLLCAVVGGEVAGTAMAKVAAGDGRLAATYGSAAKRS